MGKKAERNSKKVQRQAKKKAAKAAQPNEVDVASTQEEASDGEDTTVTEDSSITTATCAHIASCVRLPILKKVLPLSAEASCQGCFADKTETETASEPVGPEDLWVCLTCGAVSCGRSSPGQHAIKHHQLSPEHHMVIQPILGSIWCYACDNDVSPDSAAQLRDVLNLFEKEAPSVPKNKKSGVDKNTVPADKVFEKAMAVSTGLMRGLQNLGNTCFFNSILQSLGQTVELQIALHNVHEPKDSLAGLDETLIRRLESLGLNKEPPGPLTSAVAKLLPQLMASSTTAVLNPKDVLTEVCRKAPRFKGGRQHDSHELLRYLLDGIRTEEQRRREAVAKDRCSEDEFNKIKRANTFIDDVFGGRLVSRIVCHQCRTVSDTEEPFLDLSLSLPSEAPSLHHAKTMMPKTEKERAKEKKEKEKEEKNKEEKDSSDKKKKSTKEALKSFFRKPSSAPSSPRLSPTASSSSSSSSSPSPSGGLAEPALMTPPTSPSQPQEQEGVEHVKENGQEESQQEQQEEEEEEQQQQQEEEEEEEEEEEDLNQETLEQMIANKTASLRPWIAPPKTENLTLETCLGLFCTRELLQGTESFGCETCGKRAKKSVKAKPCSPAKTTTETIETNEAENTTAESIAAEPTTTPNSSSMMETPPLSADSSQETTQVCDKETRVKQKKKSKEVEPAVVYTTATKRFLIKTAPPILTLHLNRFVQNGYALRKNGQHVPFPFVLDIASFCAPDVSASSTIYELYAIVEHSGSMGGGHYVAYVRSPNSDRWWHISDSHASPALLRTVQAAQAYVLFYRRKVN